MKRSLQNFMSFRNLFLPIASLTILNKMLFKAKKFAKCVPEEDDEQNMKEPYYRLEENEMDPSEYDEFMKAMQDPTLTEEDKALLKKQLKQQSIQPLPFSKLHAPFKIGLEEEKWNGLRFILDWSLNQMNKLEANLVIDNKKKLMNNFKLSAMTIAPFNERSQNGLFLIGRKEGDQSIGLQCHANISDSVKVLLVASHPKPDLNQGHYICEISHEMERLNGTLKLSNAEVSVSAVASLYKNISVGFEAVVHPKNLSFLYNYGICIKPSPATKNIGGALSYLSMYPAVSADLQYLHNRNFSLYLSLSKNWHPMASMSGNATDLKLSTVYTKKDIFDFNFEVDYQGSMHFYHTQYLNKNFGLQVNLEFNPFAKWNKKNKTVMRSLGFGLKFSTEPVEESIMNLANSDEENFEEYSFDRISKENIK